MVEQFRKISREEFLEKYVSLHDSIFKYREYGPPSWGRFLPEFPFVNQDWEIVLLPYGELMFEDIDFFALMQATQAIGDYECIIIYAKENLKAVIRPPGKAESEGSPIVIEQGVILSWNPDVLKRELAEKSWATILDSHLFGQSGTWGVVSYDDYCFCVGGDEKFMDLFTRKAGGRSALKERFLDYNKALPMISDDLREKILARVGWNR